MATQYDYTRKYEIDDAPDMRSAVRFSVLNYFYHQLGWSEEACEARVELEMARTLPRATFDKLEQKGWHLEGQRLLDVGAGQGGALLEALERGADAYGVEPGGEFVKLSQMRLAEAGFDVSRVISAHGEDLPFPDNHFDYVISLQVLEHVVEPLSVFKEVFRVLKPGGRFYVTCENYLAFSEQHYRVPWLPLLPKELGSLYLRLIGRDPTFLNNYVYYTTYPQVWRTAQQAGFVNLSYRKLLHTIRHPEQVRSHYVRLLAYLVNTLPEDWAQQLQRLIVHASFLFRVGTRFQLQKPE